MIVRAPLYESLILCLFYKGISMLFLMFVFVVLVVCSLCDTTHAASVDDLSFLAQSSYVRNTDCTAFPGLIFNYPVDTCIRTFGTSFLPSCSSSSNCTYDRYNDGPDCTGIFTSEIYPSGCQQSGTRSFSSIGSSNALYTNAPHRVYLTQYRDTSCSSSPIIIRLSSHSLYTCAAGDPASAFYYNVKCNADGNVTIITSGNSNCAFPQATATVLSPSSCDKGIVISPNDPGMCSINKGANISYMTYYLHKTSDCSGSPFGTTNNRINMCSDSGPTGSALVHCASSLYCVLDTFDEKGCQGAPDSTSQFNMGCNSIGTGVYALQYGSVDGPVWIADPASARLIFNSSCSSPSSVKYQSFLLYTCVSDGDGDYMIISCISNGNDDGGPFLDEFYNIAVYVDAQCTVLKEGTSRYNNITRTSCNAFGFTISEDDQRICSMLSTTSASSSLSSSSSASSSSSSSTSSLSSSSLSALTSLASSSSTTSSSSVIPTTSSSVAVLPKSTFVVILISIYLMF
eukprot:TRINITY_DN7941_c0_g1_i1.p1 TRINITY_DN7941_c0_g1~~TRINITY_DN7941_c0_g1_i1.p1  ORF type:complete len:514 (+),score=99.41 TRINITY_DN7941_c0_g1_i1:3-1544(+)